MSPSSVLRHHGPPCSTLWDAIHTWGLSGVLALGMVYYLVAYVTGTYTVFDVGSLIVHEAGHFFFRSFGWTLFLLGGSLFQLLLPALFVYSFLRSGYRPGVQVALAWLGQNAMNVSVYAADAQERVPPLITGDPATHDWWQLLRAADLLAYDDVIGGAFFAVGLLAFGAALLAPRVLP